MHPSLLPLYVATLLVVNCEKSLTETDTHKKENTDEFALLDGGENVPSIEAVNVECVARVIGETPSGEDLPNPNRSLERFGFSSTDYGNMWDAGDGSLWCIFGDNFDNCGGSWKSNAIAISTDKDLTDGLYYDEVIRKKNGKMKEIIISRTKTGQYPDGSEYEVSCIPTGGVSVSTDGGNRQYVNYMSIHEWETDGKDSWDVNYSEIVYSDNYGMSWTRSGVKWDAKSHFTQVAYVKRGATIYMYGTHSGRKDNVYLAKVPADKVLDKNEYLYWDGSGWNSCESVAVPVANGYVSEMSVAYNSYYNRYIMMYLSVNQRKVVYRDAASPEGEWSAEKPILPSGYGPYIHPWFCNGRDLWFVLSSVTSSTTESYNTWHIHLYHAKLKADADGFNMIWEGGFENDPSKPISHKTLWNCSDVISSHDAHSGNISCKQANVSDGEWEDACSQTIVVHRNTDYVLTGWAKASCDGYDKAGLGVRFKDGRTISASPALKQYEWTQISVKFNSGDNTSLDVFMGSYGSKDNNVLFDDIKMTVKE